MTVIGNTNIVFSHNNCIMYAIWEGNYSYYGKSL